MNFPVELLVIICCAVLVLYFLIPAETRKWLLGIVVGTGLLVLFTRRSSFTPEQQKLLDDIDEKDREIEEQNQRVLALRNQRHTQIAEILKEKKRLNDLHQQRKALKHEIENTPAVQRADAFNQQWAERNPR